MSDTSAAPLSPASLRQLESTALATLGLARSICRRAGEYSRLGYVSPLARELRELSRAVREETVHLKLEPARRLLIAAWPGGFRVPSAARLYRRAAGGGHPGCACDVALAVAVAVDGKIRQWEHDTGTTIGELSVALDLRDLLDPEAWPRVRRLAPALDPKLAAECTARLLRDLARGPLRDDAPGAELASLAQGECVRSAALADPSGLGIPTPRGPRPAADAPVVGPRGWREQDARACDLLREDPGASNVSIARRLGCPANNLSDRRRFPRFYRLRHDAGARSPAGIRPGFRTAGGADGIVYPSDPDLDT